MISHQGLVRTFLSVGYFPFSKWTPYTKTNLTRQEVFEYDRLVRSIYTLKYLRDPQLELNICRTQNRVESYHQLRAAVAKVGGKKELAMISRLQVGPSLMGQNHTVNFP